MQVTRIELPPPPPPVAECLRRLAAANGRGWIVGGAVRDLLQGRQPRDFDLATDLLPEAVAAAMPDADLREARFGTCRTTIDGAECTITTLRAEAGYADQRHPDEVAFVTEPDRDAARRDFTVNALYYDPLTGQLYDPCGGRADLDAGLLRCIGDPVTRLQEDPLRLLRLVRFAASAGLELDPATRAAAIATAAGVASLSAERSYAELTDMFTGAGRGRALRLLVELGLAAHVLPECAAMDGVEQPPEYHPEGDVLTHVCLVLDQCPEGDEVLAWSAVLHDVGKPPTFRVAEDRIRFDGHDTLSARMADDVLRRLRAPKSVREAVVDVCLHHIRFASLPQMRPARAERWMREPGFVQHLQFHRADCLGSHGKLDIHDFAKQRLAALPPLREPLLQGRDALALGIPRGPQVGALLRQVQAEIDERPTPTTREQALVLLRDAARRLLQGGDDGAR
jgi:poly(A) polymerase